LLHEVSVDVLVRTYAQEKTRVVQQGGRWERDRMNGYLEISRAFGNVDLRYAHSDRALVGLFCYIRPLLTYLCLCLSYSDASMCQKHHGLSAESEVTKITVEEEHELLLLASDGMWSTSNNSTHGFCTGDEAVAHVPQLNPKP
jgi:serine/threonine protein phosphatase PrpC